MRPSFFHVTSSFPVHRYFSPPPVTQTKPPYHHTTAYAEIMHGPYTFSVVFIKPYILNHAKSILLFSIMLFSFFFNWPDIYTNANYYVELDGGPQTEFNLR